MKKRLLISSVLMSAVLACALGTGTYAWYQAGNGSATYTPATSGNIGTIANSYTTGAFTVAATISEPSTKVALTNGSGETWYFLQDGTTKVKDTSAGPKSASVSVGITITYGAEGLSDAEIKAAWDALNIDEVTVSVEASAPIKLGTTADVAEKLGEEVELSFDTSNLSFGSKVATPAAQSVYYGVSANESAVEQPNNSVGDITVTPAVA